VLFDRDLSLASAELGAMTVALVGLGYWGKNHLDVLSRNNSIGRILVFDQLPNLKRFEEARTGKAVMVDCISACLENSELAIIATPALTHYGLAKEFVSNGIPTFVEKPLAVTFKQCAELFLQAKERDVFMAVGYQYCFHEAAVAIKQRIGSAGSDNALPIRLQSDRIGGIPRLDVDVILDLAIHDIALALWFFERPPARIIVDEVQSCFERSLSGCAFRLCFGDFGEASIRADWHGEKARYFSVDIAEDKWQFDEVRSPGQVIRSRSRHGIIEVLDITAGTSLDHQAKWIIQQARLNKYSTDIERFNSDVMAVVNQLQISSSYLNLSAEVGGHHEQKFSL
jgi:predicted dehydrogenase